MSIQTDKTAGNARALTLRDFAKMRATGEKIAVLTCYDASFASLAHASGVDALMVGDSLGNVIQGHASTLPVKLEHTLYHVRCVARGAPQAFIIGDLPFGSYQASKEQALQSSIKLMAAGAHMVKLEGGQAMAETVYFLSSRGLPVCAHIGLTPQHVHQLGGFIVQGREVEDAKRIKNDAKALADAGASFMVLELIPRTLAQEISGMLTSCATIGIGAAPECHGQVLVLYDMLGLFPGKRPRFVKNFLIGAVDVSAAIKAYVDEVKALTYPAAEHCYT